MVRDVQTEASRELRPQAPFRSEEDPPLALESVETDEPREPFSEQPWLVTRSASSGEIRSSPGKPTHGQTWFLPDHPWALRAALVASQSLLFSLIMVSLTEARRAGAGGQGAFHFECITVTLLQESLKLAVAWTCFRSQAPEASVRVDDRRLRYFAHYSLPGLLYCVDNNFQYVILRFLQPAELAVLWNFKMFATAVLLHTFLQRRYERHQWGSMGLLVLGCALTQVSNLASVHGSGVDLLHHELVHPAEGARHAADGVSSFPNKLVGACLAIVGSTIAATSNVYCEWLVKQQPEESIHLQNMQLYFFGVVWNSLALLVKVGSEPDSPCAHGFFTGYNTWVWIIVLFGVVSGISISVALKHVDNLVVVFAHALSVVFVALASVELFDQQMSSSFASGGVLILVSLCIFHSGHGDHGEAKLSGGMTMMRRPLTPSIAGARPLANMNTPMYCLA